MTDTRRIASHRRAPQRRAPAWRGQAGFTMVELMVGLLLGLITSLIVAQVLVNAEGQRRATSLGNEAQLNGALALYAVQRDVEMSGYGFSANPSLLGCTVKGQYGGTAVTFTLAPVVITADAAGGPDTIRVVSSSKAGFALPMFVTEDHPTTTDHFVVRSSLGVSVGDMLLAGPQTHSGADWCSLFSVTAASGITPAIVLSATRVPHAEGAGTGWNHAGAVVFPAGGYDAGSNLVNMGTMANRTYSIGAQGLQMASLSSAGAAAASQNVYPHIVSLKALYGKDTSGDGVVDTYDTTTPTTVAGWRQVLAVRLAVVARSAQYEKDVVTSANPSWDVGTTGTAALATVTCNTSSKCLTLKIGDDVDTTWKHYRYKVYDTVVPLRNVLWNS